MGVTLHFQSTGTVPGSGAPVTMIGPSLTIGRGAENDVCLPDPGKVISKTHCTIEDHAGNIVITDISTNGTFLNYGKAPLGPVATPLNDGDILTMGSYELLVEIVHARSGTDLPLPPGDAGAPAILPSDPDLDDLLGGDPAGGGNDADFLDDLLGGGGPVRGPAAVNRPELGEDGLLPPLGEDEGGLLDPVAPDDGQGASDSQHSAATSDAFRPSTPLIPDDWGDDLLGGGDESDPFAEPPAATPDPTPEDAPAVPRVDVAAPPPEPEPTPEPQPAPRAETVAPPPPTNTDAARAFLDAAGAGDVDIPDAELGETMARLGGVMQTMITGLREILMTRASIKSEFRIQQTMISAGGNNPLKFSISPEQAIEAMVRPRAKGYLAPDQATQQALDDIKAHEVAVMAAMEAALKGILKQLSPEVLEGQITKGGGLSGLLQGKKARYWDVYETMYARISDQAETDFHDLFSREFARAYQAQLDRLK